MDVLFRNLVKTTSDDFRDFVEVFKVGDDAWWQTIQEQDVELKRIVAILDNPGIKNIVEFYENYTV